MFCELFFFKNAYQLSETAVCGGHSIASIAIDQRYVSPKYLITIHVSTSFLKNQFPNWNLSLFLNQCFFENEKRKYWGWKRTPLLLPFKSSPVLQKHNAVREEVSAKVKILFLLSSNYFNSSKTDDKLKATPVAYFIFPLWPTISDIQTLRQKGFE